MPDNKVRVQPMRVRAAVQSATFNEEARTVELIFGSDAPVRMRGWDGDFFEILSFDPKHINLTRMLNGAPLLDNHSRYGSVTENVLGVVESARTDGRKGYATVRFSKGERGERAMQEVKDGILRNISVGYDVTKYERTVAAKPGTLDTLRAIEWEPREVSIVPVQADPTAQVRSDDKGTNDSFAEVEFVFTNLQVRSMDNNTGQTTDATETVVTVPATEQRSAPPAVAPPVPAADNSEATRAATTAERSRVTQITEAVRAAGLEPAFGDNLVNTGVSADAARTAIIAEFAKQRNDNPTNANNIDASAGRDREAEHRRAAQSDALFLRADGGTARKVLTPEQQSAARSYQGLTLLEIAKASLQRAGISTDRLSKDEIITRAITSSTSDFPVLLEGTNRRVLLEAFRAIPDTWRQFAKVGSVSDFRVYSRLRRGTFSNLDYVNETGEYKNKAINDGTKETISAKTRGNIINVSREMIINDDLGAFTDLAMDLGRAAARSIEADVYALFALNSGNGPTMGDGAPLFDATHGNIAAVSAAPTVASIDAARVQLAIQKDINGNDFIGLTPKIWLGPIGLGGTVRVVNGSQYDVDVSNKFQIPNKVVGLYSEIVDTPRLSGTPWYTLADPTMEPVFEVVFLDGVQEPFMQQREAFRTDGMEWKVRLDYGTGAIGWRGIVKNAGA